MSIVNMESQLSGKNKVYATNTNITINHELAGTPIALVEQNRIGRQMKQA